MTLHARTAAWRLFREPIARVIHCVDQSARLEERNLGDGNRLLRSPTDGIPFGRDLSLSFALTLAHTKKQGEERMTTLRYTFSLLETGTTRRVFAWHWHPDSKRSRIKYPHVHLPAGSDYSSAHVPTGRLCLEDIVLFGFDDLGIIPAVEDAHGIVVEARDKHKRYRGWA